MPAQIRMVPVNAIDAGFLSRLELCLEERFLYSFDVERALAVPHSALNSTRGQMFLSTLTSKVLRRYPDHDGYLLAITEFDLYKTSHRYIFGDADETRKIAVLSLHRLHSEYYGEGADANVLFQRALKEAMHEIGHALGLRHCHHARCAMYYATSIFETDNKFANFCENCERRTRAAAESQ